jgi:hypothetical protein
MLKREYLMKATRYDAKRHKIGGWYVSNLLSTLRLFWDGGLSRDIPVVEVPWAGVIDPKNKGIKPNVEDLATGLWDKRGEPVQAPDAMLNTLPPLMLDGKVSWGKDDWDFAVFSSPHPYSFTSDGHIDNADMYHVMSSEKCKTFIETRNRELGGGFLRVQDGATFEEELICLSRTFEFGNTYLLHQTKLPESRYQDTLTTLFNRAVKQGSKGLVLRNPQSQWEPQCVRNTLIYDGSSL